MDKPDIKAFFVNQAMQSVEFVASASGLCGIGGKLMTKRKINNCVVIGDFESGDDKNFPFAPRVNQAAAMLADCMLEYILKN